MKKLLSIIVLGLLLSGCDLFKNPLEICMDRVMKAEGDDPAYAARVCSLANKSTKKCMTRVMKAEGDDPAYAARVCTGK